jgi:nucleoid DNA-binding protein
MRHEELARELARKTGLPAGAAQDQIEHLVQRILKKLRSGRAVELPGLGKLVRATGRKAR